MGRKGGEYTCLDGLESTGGRVGSIYKWTIRVAFGLEVVRWDGWVVGLSVTGRVISLLWDNNNVCVTITL